nr:Chain A, PawS derived peptide [Zinnia haageana]
GPCFPMGPWGPFCIPD